MKEIVGNIEDRNFIFDFSPDFICIPTNGIVKNNGEAVMGKGIAKYFADTIPEIKKVLGKKLSESGNNLYELYNWKLSEEEKNISVTILSFPTKDDWRYKSSRKLIQKSSIQLLEYLEKKIYKKVLLPRPGCGYGNLDWILDVKPIMKHYFDDRFYFISQT